MNESVQFKPPDVRIAEITRQGFYKENQRINPDLFDQVARDLGRAFAAKRGQAASVSSNQLRGFYGEVKALEIKLQEMSRTVKTQGSGGNNNQTLQEDISDQVFGENEYLVRMIVPKVAYIQGKKTGGNVSREFRDYIEASLAQVHNAKDFKVFMRLFESVVGFFYGYGGGKN